MGMTMMMTMMTTMMTSGACSATFAPRLLRTSQTLLALEPWYMPGFVVFQMDTCVGEALVKVNFALCPQPTPSM